MSFTDIFYPYSIYSVIINLNLNNKFIQQENGLITAHVLNKDL